MDISRDDTRGLNAAKRQHHHHSQELQAAILLHPLSYDAYILPYLDAR